jgi:hypothetical protein
MVSTEPGTRLDLFFLAMAHHRLGHLFEARGAFERAMGWWRDHDQLPDQYAKELAEFRAQAVLARPVAELPDDVFGGPQ